MPTAFLDYQRRSRIEHASKTRVIKGMQLELKYLEDNSAPCAHCAFYSIGKCVFPKKEEKECTQTRGTRKGWNTEEYIELDVSDIEFARARKQ